MASRFDAPIRGNIAHFGRYRVERFRALSLRAFNRSEANKRKRLFEITKGVDMKSFKAVAKSLVIGLLICVAVPATAAVAQSASSYRDTIKQYQIRVDQLSSESTTRYNGDMSQIKSWIDESLILIGKDELNKVKGLSMKISVTLDFVEASVARDKAMGKAMEAETKLKALKAEYGKLDALIQQLEAEEDVLTKKLESMKK